MGGNSSLLTLLLGVVASLFSAGTRGAEGQELLQPQGSVSVLRGENLTLECWVSPTIFNPAGPVKWFLGKGRTRKLIYSDTTSSDRVTRAEPGSNTNFTISIHNVVPEDAGTYYCVKQRMPGDQDWLSGPGNEVAVRPSQDDDNLPKMTAIPVAAGTGCSLLLLAVLFSAALYFYIKKKRGKKPSPSRPESSLPENPRTPHQATADKEIVYVDVKLQNGAQRPKHSKPEEQSTYATIR